MIGVGAIIGGVSTLLGGFDKNRYKTEYHDGTQSVNAQNKALKEQIKKLSILKKQGKMNLLPQNQTTNKLETMNTNFLKANYKKIIGGIVAVVILYFAVTSLTKKGKNKLS